MIVTINGHQLCLEGSILEQLDGVLEQHYRELREDINSVGEEKLVVEAAKELVVVSKIRDEIAGADQERINEIINFGSMTIEVDADKEGRLIRRCVDDALLKKKILEQNGGVDPWDLKLASAEPFHELGMFHIEATLGRATKGFKVWLVPT